MATGIGKGGKSGWACPQPGPDDEVQHLQHQNFSVHDASASAMMPEDEGHATLSGMINSNDSDPNHANQKCADLDFDQFAERNTLQAVAGNSPNVLDDKVDVLQVFELRGPDCPEENSCVSTDDKSAEMVTRPRCASEPPSVSRTYPTDGQSPFKDPRNSSVPVSSGGKGKFPTTLSIFNSQTPFNSSRDASLRTNITLNSKEIVQLLEFAVDNYSKTKQNRIFARKQLYRRAQVRELLQTNAKLERECRELEAEIERHEYRNGYVRAENEKLETTCVILRAEQERLGVENEELRRASELTRSEFASYRSIYEDSIINLRQANAEKTKKIQEIERNLRARNESVDKHSGQQAPTTQLNSKRKRNLSDLEVIPYTAPPAFAEASGHTHIPPVHLQPTGNVHVCSAPTFTKRVRQSLPEMRPTGQFHVPQLGSTRMPPSEILQGSSQSPDQTTLPQALRCPRSSVVPRNWPASPSDFSHDIRRATPPAQSQSPQNLACGNPRATMLPSPKAILQGVREDHRETTLGIGSNPSKPGFHNAVRGRKSLQSQDYHRSNSVNEDLNERVNLLEARISAKNGEISLLYARNSDKTEECNTLKIQVNAFRDGIQSVAVTNEQTVLDDHVVKKGLAEQGQGWGKAQVPFEQTNMRTKTLERHISLLSKELAKKDAQIATLHQISSSSPMTKDQFLRGLVQISPNEPIRSVGDVILTLNRLGTTSTRLAADNAAYKADIASLAVMAMKLIGFRGKTSEEVRDLFRSWLELPTVQRLMDNTIFMELFQRRCAANLQIQQGQ